MAQTKLKDQSTSDRFSRASGEGVGREKELYMQRFTPREEAVRAATWRALVSQFLQKYVPDTATVVDVGAGDSFFLREVHAARRIAVDLSEHALALQAYGIEVVRAEATKLSTVLEKPVDVIFMSNFLEHLPTKQLVLEILTQARRSLKPAGCLMILQPNIRYIGPSYWDYIDHHIALTEHSLVEALEISGFQIERMIPRFLPYTAKSRAGNLVHRFPKIINIYLRMPLLWRIFGAQTFVVARPIAQ